MGRDFMGRDYSPSQMQWTDNRFSAADSHIDVGRYHDTSVTTIGEALRERCKIPAEKYFVAAILDDGKVVCYGGPDEWHKKEINSFFSIKAFELAAKRSQIPGPTSGEDPDFFAFDEYGRQSAGVSASAAEFGLSRRRQPRQAGQAIERFDEDGIYKARKRPRAYRRDGGDGGDDDPPVPVRTTLRDIRVDDGDGIWNFYDIRFKNMQQTACKLVAKAWVKLVEPKKQSNHPYTGSDEKAPDWWPKPWGPGSLDRVRHKEPDHLYKKERVHLLNHIIHMIVEPNHRKHPDIQKSDLNIAKLEEATYEALSAFFIDKDTPANAKKKPFLKEIFKVAKAQEKFKNGEVDGEYKVYVMADDKFPEDWQSGDENSVGLTRQDDGQPRHSDRASTSSHASSQKATTGTHGLLPRPGNGPSPTAAVPQHHHMPHHGGSGGNPHYLNEMPVRNQQLMTSNIAAPDMQTYVDASPIHQQPVPSLQDMYAPQQQSNHGQAPRRPPTSSSIYIPQSEYGGEPGAGGPITGGPTSAGGGSTSANSAGPVSSMYPPWQHGPSPPSSSAGSAAMYNYSSQSQPVPSAPPTTLQTPFVTQNTVQIPHHSQYGGATSAAAPGPPTVAFDGLGRESYSTGSASAGVFSAMPLASGSVAQPQGYNSYMPHDGRGLSHGGGNGGGHR